MKSRFLVFPNQLFAANSTHAGLKTQPDEIVLIEDSLFFGDAYYPAKFHKQKLWLHRASMKRYEQTLRKKGFKTRYLDYSPTNKLSLGEVLSKLGKTDLTVFEPVDFILEQRLRRFSIKHGVKLKLLPTPLFLNSKDQNSTYRNGKKRWFMADFYKFQRRRLDVLMEGSEPLGGKWSFDQNNRKKVPKNLLARIPKIPQLKHDEIDEEAREYVLSQFPDHPGSLNRLLYPTSHRAASTWLTDFLKYRLELFGDYEDAIVEDESWLWHSVLTPPLNIGLLTPKQILDRSLKHADEQDVPLNSLEGFLRQIIGWREFMRATYEDLGVAMRTTNHWQHHRPMPDCFYNGTTGVLPIDDTIRRILDCGYCHHIERLMVLGGFMFLCEIDPDDIYLWFMEMFVDSYDWVMVPNAYAMSQNADGGFITTKPYFSGSSYIRKMSHHKKADWCEIWDGLYWRWIWNHVEQLQKNPRWAMMCSTAKRMAKEKIERHRQIAEQYLSSL